MRWSKTKSRKGCSLAALELAVRVAEPRRAADETVYGGSKTAFRHKVCAVQ